MAPSQIIRIPRTDTAGDGSFILGEVTSTGSKPLNVKLVATEGEEPYVFKLKHDHIGDLRVSNSPCSPDEWESILKAILLNGEPVEGIEVRAEVETSKSITITIRRRIAAITQRLGTIVLNLKANEDISLFDWCGAAALERERFREDLTAETAKAAVLEERVAELRNQLDELTQAKQAREKEILEKMCHLLNEKKVKIREQQRLLNTAKIDTVKLEEEIQNTHYVPGASRAGKRKTRQEAADEDSSDDGFEKMDVDPKPSKDKAEKGEDESADERETSDGRDEDATGSELNDDEPPISPKRDLRKTAPSAGGSTHAGRGNGKVTDTVAMHTRRRASTPPASSGAVDTPAGGDETESEDDDEL